MFNRAKALGILGRGKEADEAYAESAHAALGSDLQAGWRGGPVKLRELYPVNRKGMLRFVSLLLCHSPSPRLLLQWII